MNGPGSDPRYQERIRRRTARLDKEFAFAYPVGGAAGGKALFSRGEAEQRASGLLAKLPALPPIVLEASKPAGADVEGLETAVEKDPQLAAEVLAAGGASAFGENLPAARSLGELLERIGTAAFRSVTFVAAFRRLFRTALPWYGYAEGGLWRHLLGTALAARRLGESLGFHKLGCEALFLAGMFHDIGKPTLQGLLGQVQSGSGNSSLTVLEAELSTVNMTHTELVPLILDIWGVEHDLFAMSEHHHAPQRAGPHAVQASILQLADTLANLAGIGLESEYRFSSITLEKAAGKLNLPEQTCLSIKDSLGWSVAEVAAELDSVHS